MDTVRELAWSLCDLEIRNKEAKTAVNVAWGKGHRALALYLANQAPREQVRLASRRVYFARLAPSISRRRQMCAAARGMWSRSMVSASPGVGIAIGPFGISCFDFALAVILTTSGPGHAGGLVGPARRERTRDAIARVARHA